MSKKTKVKFQQDEIKDKIDGYMKTYQQLQNNLLKIEGAVQALQEMLQEGKED